MGKDSKYNYDKAMADLHDVGSRHPDEIYEYRSEKAFRSHMKEHGLNPDRYIRSEGTKKSSKNNSNSGCYLTTACTVSRGLPDNCDELQTLRAFRDSYLAPLPDGQAEIDHYYRLAPQIVDAIDRQTNREEIWNQVYQELIRPCVQMIHAQENERAHRLYKSYTQALFEKYLS